MKLRNAKLNDEIVLASNFLNNLHNVLNGKKFEINDIFALEDIGFMLMQLINCLGGEVIISMDFLNDNFLYLYLEENPVPFVDKTPDQELDLSKYENQIDINKITKIRFAKCINSVSLQSLEKLYRSVKTLYFPKHTSEDLLTWPMPNVVQDNSTTVYDYTGIFSKFVELESLKLNFITAENERIDLDITVPINCAFGKCLMFSIFDYAMQNQLNQDNDDISVFGNKIKTKWGIIDTGALDVDEYNAMSDFGIMRALLNYLFDIDDIALIDIESDKMDVDADKGKISSKNTKIRVTDEDGDTTTIELEGEFSIEAKLREDPNDNVIDIDVHMQSQGFGTDLVTNIGVGISNLFNNTLINIIR